MTDQQEEVWTLVECSNDLDGHITRLARIAIDIAEVTGGNSEVAYSVHDLLHSIAGIRTVARIMKERLEVIGTEALTAPIKTSVN